MTAEYEKRPGVVIQDDFTGKIIPQDNRAAAILNAPHGIIITHFDNIDPNYVKKETIAMAGVMMTALGNGRSSAWPVYAERVDADEPIEKPVLSRTGLPTFPDRIVEALDRGVVHWEAKHYSRSLNGPHPE